jgi:antitoxin component of MazEF toxin-antitoxin module
METINTTMHEKIQIRKIGNSGGIILNKGVLQVYNLKIGDEIEIDFQYPEIILRKKK